MAGRAKRGEGQWEPAHGDTRAGEVQNQESHEGGVSDRVLRGAARRKGARRKGARRETMIKFDGRYAGAAVGRRLVDGK